MRKSDLVIIKVRYISKITVKFDGLSKEAIVAVRSLEQVMLKDSQGLEISTNSSATVNAIKSFVEQLLSMGNELLSKRAVIQSNNPAIGRELALTYKKLGP